MSLKGLTVLITRPSPQGEILCEKICQAGGEAIHLPTINIAPPIDTLLLEKQISDLNQLDILIFISPQAVYQTAELIATQWPTFPPHLQIITVGEGTANALKISGMPEATFPANDWNSEGVLDLPLLQTVSHKKIAIIRGEHGRELIHDTLKDRGAILTNIIAYRRILPNHDMKPYQDLLHQKKIDIIICTSIEILQNLITLLGDTALKDAQRLPMIVIGERMRIQANKHGFHHLLFAPNASHDAMMSVLLKEKDQLCQMKKKKT